jgi:hypothetical protein
MTGARFGILSILFQQTFVDFTLDVNIQPDPGLTIDQLNQTLKLGGVRGPEFCSALCGR